MVIFPSAIALIFFLFCSSTFARVDKVQYLDNTVIPVGLQQEIFNELKKTNLCIDFVSEIETKVATKSPDEGILDFYFTTRFLARNLTLDSKVKETEVIVESLKFDISNPAFSPYRVISIQANENPCF